jgi:hypothetical protein
LVAGQDIWIDTKDSRFIDRSFLSGTLATKQSHEVIVYFRWQNLLGWAHARKIFIGQFRLIRVRTDSALNSTLFAVGGPNRFAV